MMACRTAARKILEFSPPPAIETDEGCGVASEAGRCVTRDRARDRVDAIWAVRKA